MISNTLKFSIVLLIAATNLNAKAATSLKLSNLGPWKMTEIATKSKLLGNAEIALSLPASSEGPTVLIVKLPVVGTPLTTEQWHQLVFANVRRPYSVMPPGERVYKKANSLRYTADFQNDEGAETMLHTTVMGVSISGQNYMLYFNSHPETFKSNIGAIHRLFRNIQIDLNTSARP